MNDVPPAGQDPSDDDVDALYRRASALDASRPSAWVRQAVFDHAAQVAAGRVHAGEVTNDVEVDARRWWKRQVWWRPAVFGTLAAAALAGLLVLPHVLTPHVIPAAPYSQARLSTPGPTPSAGVPSSGATTPSAAAPSPVAAPSSAAPPVAEREEKLLRRALQAASPEAPEPSPSPAPSPDRASSPRRETFAKRSAGAAAPPVAAAPVPASPPALAARGPINPAATADAAAKSAAPLSPAAAEKPREPASEPDLAFNPTLPPGYESITVEGHRIERGDQASSAVASIAIPNSGDETGLEEIVVTSLSVLHNAAEKGDLRTLQSLLRDQHTDINSRDDAGRTALLVATLHGQTKAVKLLLAHGADPNLADADGVTPLRAANGHPAIITALKRAGAH